MTSYLIKLEVSQKQAYIFASNKLKENIVNSEVIATVLSKEYIKEVLGAKYNESENLVYSGGGHVILESASKELAKEFVQVLTETVYRDFDGLQVYAVIMENKGDKSPEETMKDLTKMLESKKALRDAFFHKGSFGVEEIDATTRSVKPDLNESKKKKKIRDGELGREKSFYPQGFEPVLEFGNLGGSKNESNFIAVVHIDGNGMGKRMEEFYREIGNADWTETKGKLRAFSEAIDKDFKDTFKEMAEVIGQNVNAGNLKTLNLEGNYFPVRRLITAGDDICYVSEGRIGIESAAIFLEKLAKKTNPIDHKGYSACAGIALVHQKFPFYRAYELAEQLCSSAKSFGSKLSSDDNGRAVSSIDWHIEYGEMGDSLEAIRKNYQTADGNGLLFRPYVLDAPAEIMQKKQLKGQKYSDFRRLILGIQKKENNYSVGKLKELRGALKYGETETDNYLKFNRMKDLLTDAEPVMAVDDISAIGTGKNIEYKSFVNKGTEDDEKDKKKYTYLFDAIELLDTYIAIERGE